MPFLILGSLIGGGFLVGRALPKADSNSPVRDMTNLIMVAGTVFIGYKIFKKGI